MFNCFDIAFQYLFWLRREMKKHHREIWHLEVDLKVLRFFVSYVILQSNNGFFADDNDEKEDIGTGGYDNPQFILPMIEDFVSRIPRDIHSAYLTSGSDAALIEFKRCRDDIKFFATLINQICISLLPNRAYCREDIKFFGTVINHTCICLLANKCCCPLGHHHRLMDVFHSLEHCLLSLSSWKFHQVLKMFRTAFIASLIGFATLQGVDRMLLIALLTQLEVAAGDAVSMIYAERFDRCESRQNIVAAIAEPPQLREAYIHILTASKLSKASTHLFSPQKKNKKEEEKKKQQQQQEEEEHGLKVAKNFIDSLLQFLQEMLRSRQQPSVSWQLKALQRGLRFPTILLVEKHREFTSLDDELKDLIRVVVIDAAILIFSLFSDEWKKGDLTKESDVEFSHWQRVLQFIISEALPVHPSASSSSSFSKTNEFGYIDFLSLLQNLEQLVSTEDDSIALLKDQFRGVKDHLASLKPFLEKIAEQRCCSELQTLWNSVMELAHKAEFAIDSIIYQVIIDKPDCPPMSLGTITKEINSLKTKVLGYMTNVDNPDQPDQRVTKSSSHMSSQVSASAPKFNEFLVGLHEEQNTIIDKLTRGSNKLEIFSIVGMPGIGKTTLANKVYNHPSITYHFHFRAWCTVSQVHSKCNLVLQILGDVVSKNHNMDENDLAEKLHKHLKGKKYLIILDDVWQIDAFNLLKESFPNDENGSRLLITSRCDNLFSQFGNHHLSLLTDEDSWKLLQIKVFGEERCPPALEILGKQIAKHCKGLPLTVIIVAGVLAANSEKNCWKDVAKSLSTSPEIQEHCWEILELSYKNLPNYLKPCLLYFGAFQEDQNISVRTLLQLWISEGFVQYMGPKSLEHVAEGYLMNLISRSLVMVAKQRSSDGVKTCRVHDLIYEFCVKKAQKESFLRNLHRWNEFLDSTTLYKPRRLSLHNKEGLSLKKEAEVNEWSIYFPHLPFHHLRSLLLFSNEFSLVVGYSVFFQNFKLLRVLNIRIQLPKDIWFTFPKEVLLLVQLRYLVIPCAPKSIPSGIADLACLETLLIMNYGYDAIKLPNTIWKMKKLRHLHCRHGFIFPTDNLKDASNLHNLQTCTLNVNDFSSEIFHHVVIKFPNLRRLKCMSSRVPIVNFQVLDSLEPLESLGISGLLPLEFAFPSHLKKLTLTECRRKWSEISAIGKLPNLQVLKLLRNSFDGETWEVKEGEFPKLKFLKLEYLDICRWTASGDNFPDVEKLVLHGCGKLERLPSCLGEIPNIDMIEVTSCCKSTICSAKQIQEEQRDKWANESLKLVIHPM